MKAATRRHPGRTATVLIGVRTVEHHRNNIALKLELRGSHALLKFAVQHQSELG